MNRLKLAGLTLAATSLMGLANGASAGATPLAQAKGGVMITRPPTSKATTWRSRSSGERILAVGFIGAGSLATTGLSF